MKTKYKDKTITQENNKYVIIEKDKTGKIRMEFQTFPDAINYIDREREEEQEERHDHYQEYKNQAIENLKNN